MNEWSPGVVHSTGQRRPFPQLIARKRVDALLSEQARHLWDSLAGLLERHAALSADLQRAEQVELPEAQSADRAAAHAAARKLEDSKGPIRTSQVEARIARLRLDLAAVGDVRSEAATQLHQALVADQSRMVRQAFEAMNTVLADTGTDWRVRLDAIEVFIWCCQVDERATAPQLAERASFEAAEQLLASGPSELARRSVEGYAALLRAPERVAS